MTALGIRSEDDLTLLRTAEALLRRGARTTITQTLTQLPRGTVAALHTSIHHRPAPSGLLATSTLSFTRSPRKHLHAALYAVILRRLLGNDNGSLDVGKIIQAYDLYNGLTPSIPSRDEGIDMNEAWVIARDLHANCLQIKRCSVCWTPYIVLEDGTGRCPCCVLDRRNRSAPPGGEYAQHSIRCSRNDAKPVAPASALKGIKSPADRRQLEVAVELIKRGTRAVLVSAITGIPRNAACSLYRDIHGDSPASGQLPTGACNIIVTRRVQVEASLFATILAKVIKLTGLKDMGEWLLLAYDLYSALRKEKQKLSINTAWVIARDMRSGAARLKKCRQCGASFLIATGMQQAPVCPCCPKRKLLRVERRS